MFKGIPASYGIAIARIYFYKPEELVIEEKEILPQNVKNEIQRFKEAIEKSRGQIQVIETKTKVELGKEKAAIFGAHLLVLKDSLLIEEVKHIVKTQLINAEAAVQRVIDHYVRLFESMQDDYMDERVVDLKDVGRRLQSNLLGYDYLPITNLEEPVILVAKDLTPSDTAQMDKKNILGLVTEIGGPTSHTAILARSLEIPAVVGVGPILEKVAKDTLLIIDGNKGVVIANPDEETLDHYQRLRLADQAELAELYLLKELPAKTLDGFPIKLLANIGGLKEAKRAFVFGAEGIGLYRTEYLFMDKENWPEEEMQFVTYRDVIRIMPEKPTVIRTLDIGGDKELPYFKMPKERNPFLGWKGIRFCLDRKDIFKTQLRAILRASAFGKVRIMFPMISGLQEVREAKGLLAEVKKELTQERIAFDPQIKVGIMIEVPSAAIIADLLAKEVDFFSIGTNDLIQYNLSLDRTNEKISNLYDIFHPGVLRLIKFVIQAAEKEGIEVGMCGEMASDIVAVPVLLGLGLKEFSMSPISLLKVKKVIRGIFASEVTRITKKVLRLDSSEDIRKYLKTSN